MWRIGGVSDGKLADLGLLPGGVAFETFQLCRRSSIMCDNLPTKFDIYSIIFDSNVGNFVRPPGIVVLLLPFRVSNFSVSFLYIV